MIKDFKGFTSRKIIATIKENPKESRKAYLLKMFEEVGSTNSNVEKYQLWQHDNKPIEVNSNKKEGLVVNPHRLEI